MQKKVKKILTLPKRNSKYLKLMLHDYIQVKINYDNYKIKRCFAEEVDEEDEEDDEEEEDEFHSHVDSSDQTLAFNNRGSCEH